jgi:sugar O-acyltransferase (sialic acid O-acetyltransferase NeuD family)
MSIILLGAGGFAKEARVWCHQAGHNVVGFVDDTKLVDTKSKGKAPLPIWRRMPDENNHPFLVAVGDPLVKMLLVDRAHDDNFSPVDAILHPSVIFGTNIAVGPGTIICPRCVVTADIRIGMHCLINLGVTIGHDTMIGDYVTVSPGAHISGNVTIGRGAYIGTGAVIREGVTIGDKATIGMGAVVIRDVPDSETWAGNPARKIA